MSIPNLTTRRLTLRPLVAGDAGAIAQGINDWEVTKWLTVVPFPYAQVDAEQFIQAVSEDQNSQHLAIDAGNGLIGAISAKPDLGYWLARTHHGRGYMTEAVEAVLTHYFQQNEGPLVSGYHFGNDASAAIQWKFGFVKTQVEEVTRVSTGTQVNLQRTELTRQLWEARNG